MRFVVALALLVPKIAFSGCPLRGGQDMTCSSDASSIEGCTNLAWMEVQTVNGILQGSQPGQEHAPVSPFNLEQAKAYLRADVMLLAEATSYRNPGLLHADCTTTPVSPNRGPLNLGSIDITTVNLTIERCELQRQTALNGMALLSNPLVADALPETTRARLKTVYASLEETYTNRLTSLARIATADPAQFCTETYATIQACRQAIANDTEALRKKIFPLYRCGQLVPGQFVDGTTGPAEEAAHANDPPEKKIPWLLSTTPYSTIISFYQNRLSKEKTLLTKALPVP